MRRPTLASHLFPGVRRAVGLEFLAHALGRRWHYAWVVLACGMAIVFMSAGVRFSFGVFLPLLSERFGWSVGAISLAFFIGFLSGVPLTMAGGWLVDTLGMRAVALFGVAVFTLGMLLTATVTHLGQFYLFYGVLMGAVGLMFAGLLPSAVTRWFHRRTGLAVGLMFTSTGSGPLVLAPLFGWLIARAGWMPTFVGMGVVGGVLMLGAALLLRSHPREMGTTAYGAATASGPANPGGNPAPRVTMGMVRRDRSFWFLVMVHFLGCVGHSVLLAHVVRLGMLQGVPGVVAAGLVSAVSGTSVISRFGVPILTERWGGRATLALGFLLQSLAILLYLGAEGVVALYLVSLLFGLGYGAEMSGFPIINRQYYGAGAPLNSIHAWQWSGGLVGMGVGGWLGGVLFDWAGTYTWSIGMAALAGLAALPLILALPRKGERPALPVLMRGLAGGAGSAR